MEIDELKRQKVQRRKMKNNPSNMRVQLPCCSESHGVSFGIYFNTWFTKF